MLHIFSPVIAGGRSLLSVKNWQHAIRPFMRHGIETAVQLAHGDRLWVDDFVIDSKFLH